MVKIAIMGFGIVGSGVAEVVTNHKEDIGKKICGAIELKYILDIRDFPGNPFESKLTKDFNVILEDPEIDIVVETMGGTKPAYAFTKALLEKGKSVITSNKELVATHGAELLKIANENNANYLFEASVGGGIPIIRPLAQCLAANEILAISGILNGTTNYILTKMFRDGESFETALADAQAKGYAEKDPTADIEGHDTCRKVCILASLAYGEHLYPEKVYTEGITKITAQDVRNAEESGYVIKLLGRIRRVQEDKVFAMVSPCLVEKSSPIANVDDVFNGVLVTGDSVDDVMFYGRGAGKLPTASAVVADVIDAAKHMQSRKWISWKETDRDFVVDHLDAEERYYLRVAKTANAEAGIADIFGNVCYIHSDCADELAFITEKKVARNLEAECEKLCATGIEIKSKIRLL